MDVSAKIFRYRPGDPAPRYQTFRVSVPEAANVIDVIDAAWRQDSTLMFRHACHHAACGTCAVRVNGYEKLACIVPVQDALVGRTEIILEPLRNFSIIGDLVVEVSGFFQKQSASGMGLTRAAEVTANTPVEMLTAEGQWEARVYNRFENCIECGICLSACPTMAATDKFFGPAGLAAIHRATQATTDPVQRHQLLALADNEQGLWRCHSAYECTEACPQNVDPAGAIMSLRRAVVGQKVKRWLGK